MLFLELYDVLLEQLLALLFVVGRSKDGFSYDNRPYRLPPTVMFDFRMRFQHVAEICA